MFYTGEDGRVRFRAHVGQQRALDSTARFILVLAGLQSGKTSAGPWWMMREMALCGAGDYLGAGPTFPLMEMKMLPEYEALFVTRMGWGRLYRGYPPVLVLNEAGRTALFGTPDADETRIIFGAGSKPESLESATVKAAHLDEAGQKQFRRASHEAVQGRLSIHRGRCLYTTTPYVLGWLKSEVYDRALAERALPAQDRTYELVQFASTMNPAFPRAEFAEMRAKLPPWKFGMRYEGRFERPAGLIYDVFRREAHVTNTRPTGPTFAGLDFGGVNTAAVEVTQVPSTLRYVVTRAYRAGSRTAAEHAAALTSGGHPKPVRAWGGAPSEDNWRREFGAAGFPIAPPPVAAVEVGIDRVYAMLKNHPALAGTPDPADPATVLLHDPARPSLEIWAEAEGAADLLDEVESYSRELDDNDEPTEAIANKSLFHLLDALRYFAAGVAKGPAPPAPRSRVSSPLGYR